MLSRIRLPRRRPRSRTIEATVKGVRIFLTVGEHADGSVGEVFIDVGKTGSAFRELMCCFSILVSLCLQHGVPLSLLVKRFAGVNFEPSGTVTGQPGIDTASSIVDCIFRMLANEYPEQAGEGKREAAE